MYLRLLFLLVLFSCDHSPKNTLTRFHGNEMTMDYSILVGNALSKQEEYEAQEIIDDTFSHINAIHNNWNPDSEVSHVNHSPAQIEIPLSDELLSFLELCQKLVIITGGRFDPTISPLQQLWRGKLEQGLEPTQEEISRVQEFVGWDKLHIKEGFLIKEHPETALDFGGIAKGHCVDLLIDNLKALGYDNIFVEWGAEIRTIGQHPDKRPWQVAVRNPFNANDSVRTLPFNNDAIATSGDYWQLWPVSSNGKTKYFTHIIDPKTSRALSTQALTSVSVIANTCALADGLATAGMIFEDPKEAQEWANRIQTESNSVSFLMIPKKQDSSALR